MADAAGKQHLHGIRHDKNNNKNNNNNKQTHTESRVTTMATRGSTKVAK